MARCHAVCIGRAGRKKRCGNPCVTKGKLKGRYCNAHRKKKTRRPKKK